MRNLFPLIMLILSAHARADFMPKEWDPRDIEDFEITECRLSGLENDIPTGEMYRIPRASVFLGNSLMEWDENIGAFIGKIAGLRIAAKRVVPSSAVQTQTIEDKDLYVIELRKVKFMAVSIIGEDGKRPVVRNADHQIVSKNFLTIGNYNGVFYNFAASNSSSLSLITIYNQPNDGRYASVTVHCDLKAKFR